MGSVSPSKMKMDDIEEVFIRSSGPGGQNVNKVATCVVLKHKPTGIVVKCRKFRTQHQNRMQARRLLDDELRQRLLLANARQKALLEKKRRQVRGRSKAGQENVLKEKKIKALMKKSRQKVLAVKDF